MKHLLSTVALMLAVAAGASPSAADIYIWTDAAGVKHITNYSPPPQAELLMRTPEIPYDEDADRQRRDAERSDRLARERQELLEKEAALALREREAAQRIADAERRAAAALERSVQLQDEVREDSYDGPGAYGYYYRPFYQKHHRQYFRRDGNIYYHRPEHPPHRRGSEPPVRVRKKQAQEYQSESEDLPQHSLNRTPPGNAPSGRRPEGRPDRMGYRF